MIVCVGIEKGGVGKSTAASNIAVYRASQGKKVALIDADVQSTVTDWYGVREDREDLSEIASFDVYTEKEGIDEVAYGLVDQYDDIIIDVGGKADAALGESFVCADKIIMPVRPSQPDLWTVDKMAELIPTINEANKNVLIKLLFSQVPTNPFNTEYQLAKSYVSEYDNIEVSQCIFRERKAYRDAFVVGLGVVEMKYAAAAKARAEVQLLGQEIWE